MSAHHLFLQENFSEALEHNEFPPYAITPAKYRTMPSDLQRTGLSFMFCREVAHAHGQRGGIISDALGTGKTFQTLAHLAENLHRTVDFPQKTLIVAPSAVLHEWKRQAATHLQPGVLRIHLYHGSTRKTPEWDDFDVLLTTYGTVRSEYSLQRAPVADGFSHWFRRVRGVNEPSVFSRLFDRIVLDEAHQIRNNTTKQSKAVCELNADFHWCITATPIYNGIEDLHGLFKFLQAHPLCDADTFRAMVTSRIYWEPVAALEFVRGFLYEIQLRRSKESLNLPPLHEHILAVQLSESERLFYDALRTFSRDTVMRLIQTEKWLRTTGWARAHASLGQRARQCMLSVILRLRQACVHPQMALDAFKSWRGEGGRIAMPKLVEAAAQRLKNLVDGRENPENSEECIICLLERPESCLIPCGHMLCETCSAKLMAMSAQATCPMCRAVIQDYQPIERALATMEEDSDSDDESEAGEWDGHSSKIRAVQASIRQFMEHDPTTKVLVFSQWKDPLTYMEKALDEIGVRHVRIDGSVPSKRRVQLQEDFNMDPSLGAMMCSLQCCSEGMNLQGANVVYLLDFWWTDSREKQAGNRAHRVGQTRPVTIFHVLAEDTIENNILDLQQRKRSIMDATDGTVDPEDLDWDAQLRGLLDLDVEA